MVNSLLLMTKVIGFISSRLSLESDRSRVLFHNINVAVLWTSSHSNNLSVHLMYTSNIDDAER